ncbi:hypothetical protein KIMH_09060 [Bombiscardovia apis]|uniref:Membrane associated protein n=1 Tax=Bombiscardovia apis TaxID=2932182 RepID=A0ABN6SFK2_9BIFI|nr:hypothetical protein [Bombiscardovia apis]BDR54795.1 hypothetical protein KIMH_09060 [Bombiscardovia apis]
MTSTTVTLRRMTQHKNSNDDDKPQHSADSSQSSGSSSDDSWQAFVSAHSDDLSDIESSHTAKRFERKARKDSKKAALKASDLDHSAFVSASSGAGRGPRDFSSSWLDTDQVMDQASDFVPPNPQLGHPSAAIVLYALLSLIGVIGLVAALFAPRLPGILGPIFALCTLIGVAGLISSRKDFRYSKDPGDDGARV